MALLRIELKDPDARACLDVGSTRYADLSRWRARVGEQGIEEPCFMENLPDEIFEGLKRWFSYGEYLTVEVDTDTWTIEVVEVGQ